ncbi:MAG: aldose epimerase family protein, partial [Pseudomonadota bacterium]
QIAAGTLESAEAQVEVIAWGASLRRWSVALPGGGARDCALGLRRIEDYPAHSPAMGAIVGRVANRISGAAFPWAGGIARLDAGADVDAGAGAGADAGAGAATDAGAGTECLHGGPSGLGRQVWEMEADDAASALRLRYDSPPGEGGFPGALDVEVVLRLEGAALLWEMRAVPDRETPVNLAQHVYWNLDGGGAVADHSLRLAASRYTPLTERLVPTGEIAEVAGTPFDFRRARPLRGAGGAPLGVDLNFCLDASRAEGPAAEVLSSDAALRLRLWTDRPGLQVFDMAGMTVGAPGLGGAAYGPFAGLCLEAQGFPDAVNRPEFPSILCSPEEPFAAWTRVEIAPPTA